MLPQPVYRNSISFFIGNKICKTEKIGFSWKFRCYIQKFVELFAVLTIIITILINLIYG